MMTLIDNPKWLRFMHPAAAQATYINAIKSAVQKATPETAEATTVDAAATAMAIACLNSPTGSTGRAAIDAILASVNKEDDDPVMVASLYAKLKELYQERLDVMANLSPEVQKRVESLKELQRQHDESFPKMWEEMAEIEKQDGELEAKLSKIHVVGAKYRKFLDPLYEERRKIVSGQDFDQGVPLFWLHAMDSDKGLDREISWRDAKAMAYLKDIKFWKTDDDNNAAKFEFFFDPNPFFENQVLTKTLYHSIMGDRVIIHKAVGAEIEWYPGQCLTTHKVGEKRKRRSSSSSSSSGNNCKSFFSFFATQEGEESERNLYICNTLRAKIIPHAVTCFLDPAPTVDYIRYLDRRMYILKNELQH